MDIQEIFDDKIKGLPDGPYLVGLRAVKSHIDAAVRHFERAKSEKDEALFTDVIFRCNQAFEGSIKEAYRVLAKKDPTKVRPYDIEKFPVSNEILRKKVLDQFTNYRQEWRNPATHDYTLDFDEDEALIAVVSVTVFAIVLTDQIDGRMAYETTASATPSHTLSPAEKSAPLLELVTNMTLEFARSYVAEGDFNNAKVNNYYKFEGTFSGYLASQLSSLPDIKTELNARFVGREADVVVQRGSEKIVVEVKLARGASRSGLKSSMSRAVAHVSALLHEPDVFGAVVLFFSTESGEYEVSRASGNLSEAVRIVSPRLDKSFP